MTSRLLKPRHILCRLPHNCGDGLSSTDERSVGRQPRRHHRHSSERSLRYSLFSSFNLLLLLEDEASLSTIHGYPSFRNAIEDPTAFARGELVVVFSLAADGYRPKRVSKYFVDAFSDGSCRGQWWPGYLLCDSLSKKERDRLENFVVTCIVSTRGQLKERQLDYLLIQARRTIDEINSSGLRLVDGSGREWSLRVKIANAVLDLDVSLRVTRKR